MRSFLVPAVPPAASVVPALFQLPCTVRRSVAGASPPGPWRPDPWQRWLPWWWFR
ncbi:hypothetical protein [Lentzea flava]|uniref:hypothetical protein n=1 Tax=Lentzea flava TaxID=103732 RepID=UPI0016704B7F|nr:hypothetical protein [Lentzea flava]MCP2201936.1 hypothetical protein [Lentzea flava]